MPQIMKDITEITRVSVQYRTDSFAPMGLKACHGSYLQEICARPGISQEQLAESICINKSNVARQAAALEEPVTVQWLLRTKDAGVYPGAVSEVPGMGQYGEFICPLDEMLDALYQEQGAWPTSPCTMELYLNGELAGRGTFSIGR